MKKLKIYYIVALPLLLVALFWLFTQAFHLLTAASDIMVIAGAVLMRVALLIIFKLCIFAFNKIV